MRHWGWSTNKRSDQVQRFYKHIQLPEGDGCWEFDIVGKETGYGYLAWWVKGVKKYLRAHRISWAVFYGPIPKGMHVLHRCDNKPCVRPDHLFLGTNEDNAIDAAIKRGKPYIKVNGKWRLTR